MALVMKNHQLVRLFVAAVLCLSVFYLVALSRNPIYPVWDDYAVGAIIVEEDVTPSKPTNTSLNLSWKLGLGNGTDSSLTDTIPLKSSRAAATTDYAHNINGSALNEVHKSKSSTTNNKSSGGNVSVSATPSNSTSDNTNKKKKTSKTLSHFLFHIPKTGGEYALDTISKILGQEMIRRRIPKSKQFRACNQATTTIDSFETKYRDKFKGVQCTMWMSEVRYHTRPTYKYIILRNPIQHTVSQYFHCRESKDHAQWKKYKTPKTIDKWLKNWLDIQHNNTNVTFPLAWSQQATKRHTPNGYDPTTYSEQARAYKKKTYCYNPTNMQSYIAKFDVTKRTIQDLEDRFTVLGDNAQMTKTICMIMIKYSGGWIPQVCNCSNRSTNHNSSDSQQRASSTSNFNYNASRHGHGVKHHGATYNMTSWQRDAIDNLTKYDQVLYDWGRQIFDKQVQRVEKEYNVQLCDTFAST